MKHAICAIVAGLAVTACATTSSGTGMAGAPAPSPVATSAFDYAPSRTDEARIASSRFGYELVGADGWTGEMRFIEEGGEPLIILTLYDTDGAPMAAELSVEMPYLSGGVRRFSGQTNSGNFVEVALQAGPCGRASDDATHFARVEVGDEEMTGCASENAVNERWSRGLMSYLPAIDACMREVPDAEHVTLAQPGNGGGVGVRLANRSGQRWECNTRSDGRVNAVRTLDPADAMLGEGDPIFVRSSMPGNGDGCYAYEAVRQPNGDLIGAFGYDTCIGPGGALG